MGEVVLSPFTYVGKGTCEGSVLDWRDGIGVLIDYHGVRVRVVRGIDNHLLRLGLAIYYRLRLRT